MDRPTQPGVSPFIRGTRIALALALQAIGGWSIFSLAIENYQFSKLITSPFFWTGVLFVLLGALRLHLALGLPIQPREKPGA